MRCLRAAIIAASLCLVGIDAGANPAEVATAKRPIDILSFNIRYGTARDRGNAWPKREVLVYDVIRGCECDFVGLQEGLRFQIDEIHAAVDGYGEVGVGRDDGKESGEYSAILYRRDRWQVGDSGTFWLSDSPSVAGSRSWGNFIPRIVTWGRFVERSSGRAIRVFNTHFDHLSQASREKGARLLAARIAGQDSDAPVVVTGDFNAGEDNPAIRYLTTPDGDTPFPLVDTFRVLHPDAVNVGTFGGFKGRRRGPKIDYVFTGSNTEVLRAEILRVNENGRYPSDHYPVYARLEF